MNVFSSADADFANRKEFHEADPFRTGRWPPPWRSPCRTGPARAHGDAEHPDKPEAVRKEQKPWGIAGDAKAVKRTIEFSMTDDMRFTPDRLEVKQGETVRFVLKNAGSQMHEFVLGTKAELDEHAALMVRFPNMEHDEPYMAHVPPARPARSSGLSTARATSTSPA